jgi:benzoyl-CoA reductase/2-hydroxyglutaryl-CoA dehydratase subunit BcrC/BadD/HgdB
MSGHSLAECWYVFEELKPQGMKLYNHRIQKTKKAVEDDEQLKEKIEQIREKMKKEAKPGKKTKNVRFEDQE